MPMIRTFKCQRKTGADVAGMKNDLISGDNTLQLPEKGNLRVVEKVLERAAKS